MGRLLDAHPLLKKGMVYLLVFLTTTFLTGCNYYTSKRLSSQTFEKIMKENKEKYLVVHLEKDVWRLANPRIENNRLVGTLDTLDTFRRQYLLEPEALNAQFQPGHPVAPREVHFIPVDKEKAQYLEKSGGEALWECHILLPDRTALQGEEQLGNEISISLDAAAELYMYKKADAEWVVFWIVLGALVIAVFVLFYPEKPSPSPSPSHAPSPSTTSCPFAYVFDGQQFSFQGELFSSALFPCLERDDYLPLPRLKAREGQFNLLLADEMMEQQFIDQASLYIVEHPEGTQALIDQNGQVSIFNTLQPPANAESQGGLDVTGLISTRDQQAFQFDNPEAAFNHTVLTFEKPAGATHIDLWLTAKNTHWFELVWEEYNSKFGSFYAGQQEKLAQKPAETLNQWAQDQGIPMAVYLDTGNGWQNVEYIPSPGPFGWRELVVPLDLSSHHDTKVRIKLEAGFHFWELDYAAASFSGEQTYSAVELLPQFAWGNDGGDYTYALSHPDGDYLSFPGPGHRVWISYEAPPATVGMQQSAFLHGKGYYHLIRDYKGLPEIGDLRHIKKPGFLPELSKELYLNQL